MLEHKKVARFILFRLAVVTVFLVSAIILDLNTREAVGEETLTALTRLIIATYAFSFISLAVLKFSAKQILTLTYAQIVWDLILVTTLVLITGGVNSPYAFLYFLSIISASILHERSESYYTASLCVILYGAILDLQYYGRLDALGLSPLPAQQHGAGYLFYLIFLYSLAFYLTAFLSEHLAERARLSESALKEKAIDLEELERLNSSIVSTIDSGLLTINPEGRIGVFNRWAEQLIGVTQREAYDRPLTEVIPGFAPFGKGLFGVLQGEFGYLNRGGEELILSFKSVPFSGKGEENEGAIIDLRDLTEMKRLSEELKRADRLAAVGELSARMAHEIRNPLAAISGSVQLVALSQWAQANDRRLLSIIIRETDRLDGLLREFLSYARPEAPEKVPLNLRQVIEDLCSLLSSDPRFQKVTLENLIPEGLTIRFDKNQCEQIFWNLMVNGAEAIEESGRVAIRASRQTVGWVQDQVCITVSDDGCGMDPSQVKRVFEPFFTTKKGGSGLGLATVYRIVEAHGGRVDVASEQGSGTTFTITVPQGE